MQSDSSTSDNLLQSQGQPSYQSSNTSSVLSGNAAQSTLQVSGGSSQDIPPNYMAIAVTALLVAGVIALILISLSSLFSRKK